MQSSKSLDVFSTENELVSRRFRNSPHYATMKVVSGGNRSDKSATSNSQDEIFSAIATGDEGQKLGDRLSEILNKVFGKTNDRYELKTLSFPEISCLSDFLAVSTRIFLGADEKEVVGLKCFMLKFNRTDLFRLLNLAAKDKIGNPVLARGISDILMMTC
ncbi:MAG: hypothetical protein US70_C0002G0046 [Parcubacteria group bacterium GW2011_GWD2_38_11]|nr:MAG: hypothetical protein US70_C0002G0046 [Parcubacteria group bacterium GW2011_GWD2_38_11]